MPDPPSASSPSPTPDSTPESEHSTRFWPGLDRLGVTQALGGGVLGLIALFSSYDHLNLFGHPIPLPQQWGIPCIAASVALIFIDAQLATRARDRGANAAKRAADEADRRENEAARERHLAREERQRADRERNLADRERNRAAEEDQRQRESFERLDQGALLSARVQLDPSPLNRARLGAFLALMAERQNED